MPALAWHESAEVRGEMLRSVLIPTDLGDDTENIMRFAAGCTRFGVQRALVTHVIEASGMEGPVIMRAMDTARGRLGSCVAPLRNAGIQVELRVVTGDPGFEIAVLAEHANMDGIIIGSRARGAIHKLFVGSVSEDVVTQASQPTLRVRFDMLNDCADPARYGEDFPYTLVVPVDFSASSTRAVLAVTQLPAGSVGTAVLVNVLDSSLSGEKLEVARQSAQFQLAGITQLLADAGIESASVVREGNATDVILDEIERRGATGCVTGSRGRAALQEAMLGSTSMGLVRKASCPVLTVP